MMWRRCDVRPPCRWPARAAAPVGAGTGARRRRRCRDGGPAWTGRWRIAVQRGDDRVMPVRMERNGPRSRVQDAQLDPLAGTDVDRGVTECEGEGTAVEQEDVRAALGGVVVAMHAALDFSWVRIG